MRIFNVNHAQFQEINRLLDENNVDYLSNQISTGDSIWFFEDNSIVCVAMTPNMSVKGHSTVDFRGSRYIGNAIRIPLIAATNMGSANSSNGKYYGVNDGPDVGTPFGCGSAQEFCGYDGVFGSFNFELE